ncbi:hypothetical protein PTSG_03136 [Salpingoeca rosetta]|uniref:Uncharacterized protein n=1 Tax=Salpingoeca rosetta (strain ATCC 50818 / BSB-021) TaxID=946362 RepID=F2U4C1_SALR5|nr:uncharacterized protein PTSG_03136 [Salpingoeca rosetta]EGD82487.1 hypothetical protein PTSG_03136 [Salpingoeca rosetta]|eukprot:XP_004995723.1 hypothetical protein PTSG_03136 [Salpingoeca rosetta]
MMMSSNNSVSDSGDGSAELLQLAVLPACLLAAEVAYVWYCATVRHAEPSEDTKEQLHTAHRKPQPYELTNLGYDFHINTPYSFGIRPTSSNSPHPNGSFYGGVALPDIHVSITHVDSQEPAEVYKVDVHDGSYIVSFMSGITGLHEIEARVNGHHIEDSPRLILLQ